MRNVFALEACFPFERGKNKAKWIVPWKRVCFGSMLSIWKETKQNWMNSSMNKCSSQQLFFLIPYVVRITCYVERVNKQWEVTCYVERMIAYYFFPFLLLALVEFSWAVCLLSMLYYIFCTTIKQHDFSVWLMLRSHFLRLLQLFIPLCMFRVYTERHLLGNTCNAAFQMLQTSYERVNLKT